MTWEAKPVIRPGSISQKKITNWEAKPVIDSGSTNVVDSSIHELMSTVRSAFRQIDFDKVEKDLLRREEDLKRALRDTSVEAGKWKKAYESMEKKHGELTVVKLEMEEKLKKHKIECGDMREKVIQLGEDKRVYSDREKRANERYEKLLEDFNTAESEKKQMIVEIRNENAELKSANGNLSENAELKNAKNEAEAKVENWKNIYKDLEARVSRLEKEFAILVQKIEDLGVENSGNQKSQNDNGVDTDSPNLMGPQTNGSQANCCQKMHPSPGACSACNSPVIGSNSKPEAADPHFINMVCYNEGSVGKKLVFETGRHGTAADAIDINDSDDEVSLSLMYKRKRSSSCEKLDNEDDGDEDNMPIGRKLKRERIEDLSHASIVSLANPDLNVTNIAKLVPPSGSDSDSDDSSSDSGDEVSDSYMNNLIEKLRKSRNNF